MYNVIFSSDFSKIGPEVPPKKFKTARGPKNLPTPALENSRDRDWDGETL